MSRTASRPKSPHLTGDVPQQNCPDIVAALEECPSQEEAAAMPKSLYVKIGAVTLAVALISLGSVSADAVTSRATAKQYGLNTYVQDLCQSAPFWSSEASGQFAAFKALGANSVALAFPVYTASLTSNSIVAQRTCGTNFQSPSPARIAVAVKIAHSMHLRVLLRPLLEETSLSKGGGWRGVIKPSNTSLWFKNYLATLVPYLDMARQQKVEWFSIAAELDSMAHNSRWPAFIASAKRHYHGSVIFTINWEEGAAGKVKWGGTTPGMDTYQATGLPPTASVSQLLLAWNNALKSTDTVPFAISSATIDEIVILAQDGAYATPYKWSLPFNIHPFDQMVQANWYSMACSFFKMHNMSGIYYWGVWYRDGANAFPKSPTANDPQGVQPASAAVIKKCFTGK